VFVCSIAIVDIIVVEVKTKSSQGILRLPLYTSVKRYSAQLAQDLGGLPFSLDMRNRPLDAFRLAWISLAILQ
jgi:hypothetical protein